MESATIVSVGFAWLDVGKTDDPATNRLSTSLNPARRIHHPVTRLDAHPGGADMVVRAHNGRVVSLPTLNLVPARSVGIGPSEQRTETGEVAFFLHDLDTTDQGSILLLGYPPIQRHGRRTGIGFGQADTALGVGSLLQHER